MEGGEETVSPYSEWVGWSGVVVVEGGSLAYLTKAGRKLGIGGSYCLAWFCYDFFPGFFKYGNNLLKVVEV